LPDRLIKTRPDDRKGLYILFKIVAAAIAETPPEELDQTLEQIMLADDQTFFDESEKSIAEVKAKELAKKLPPPPVAPWQTPAFTPEPVRVTSSIFNFQPSLLHSAEKVTIKDPDENDYDIEERYHFYLPESATSEKILDFKNALRTKKDQTARNIVEQVMQRPLTAKEHAVCVQSLEGLIRWLDETESGQTQREADGLPPGRDFMPLPPSANSFSMHHERLNRDRRIAPFEQILCDKMSGFMLGLVINAVEEADNPNHETAEETADAFYRIK